MPLLYGDRCHLPTRTGASRLGLESSDSSNAKFPFTFDFDNFVVVHHERWLDTVLRRNVQREIAPVANEGISLLKEVVVVKCIEPASAW